MKAIVVPSAMPTQMGDTSQATATNATSSNTCSDLRRVVLDLLGRPAPGGCAAARDPSSRSELRLDSLVGGAPMPAPVRVPVPDSMARAIGTAGVAEVESSSLMAVRAPMLGECEPERHFFMTMATTPPMTTRMPTTMKMPTPTPALKMSPMARQPSSCRAQKAVARTRAGVLDAFRAVHTVEQSNSGAGAGMTRNDAQRRSAVRSAAPARRAPAPCAASGT